MVVHKRKGAVKVIPKKTIKGLKKPKAFSDKCTVKSRLSCPHAFIISQASDNIKHLIPIILPFDFRDYDCIASDNITVLLPIL